jgi:hypothetical protein
MNRIFAVMCVLPAAVALGDLNYTADFRVCRAQLSFGQNVLNLASPAYSPFHSAAQVGSPQVNGNCFAHAIHDSELQSGSMSGSGSADSTARASAAPATLFSGTGTSTFSVNFTLTAPSNLSLSGMLSGTSGRSNLQARLAQGGTTYFLKTSAGSFVHDEHLVTGVNYTLTVSAACTATAVYAGALVEQASVASFNFVATLVGASCTGDLNRDNFVDDPDFVLFANAYDIFDCADPAMPVGCPADLNHDQFVDDTDFVVFATAYDGFVCPS